MTAGAPECAPPIEHFSQQSVPDGIGPPQIPPFRTFPSVLRCAIWNTWTGAGDAGATGEQYRSFSKPTRASLQCLRRSEVLRTYCANTEHLAGKPVIERRECGSGTSRKRSTCLGELSAIRSRQASVPDASHRGTWRRWQWCPRRDSNVDAGRIAIRHRLVWDDKSGQVLQACSLRC